MDIEKKKFLGVEIDKKTLGEGLFWLGVLAGFEGLVWLVTGQPGLGWRVDGNVVTDGLAIALADKGGTIIAGIGLINMAANAFNRNRNVSESRPQSN